MTQDWMMRGILGGLVLAASLISAQAWAHTQALPSCSRLPTDAEFFGDDETAVISTSALLPTFRTKRGTGESGEGDLKYHYAKITVPQLAAGELRVAYTADATSSPPDPPADAVLCHGSRRASYKTAYSSDHTREEGAARTARDRAKDADDDAMKAHDEAKEEASAAQEARDDLDGQAETNALDTIEGRVRANLRTAASDLRTAADRLADAARALDTAGLETEAAAARIDETEADRAADAADDARKEQTTEGGGDPNANGNPNDEILALYSADPNGDTTPHSDSAAEALARAARDLITAATALEGAAIADPHTGFTLRAEVKSSEGEYILVVALPNPATPNMPNNKYAAPDVDADGNSTASISLATQFHGALVDDDPNVASKPGGSIPKADDEVHHPLTVTAPGLLTLKATGTANISGELRHTNTPDAKTSGTASAFTMIVPVPQSTDAYTFAVISQSRSPLSYDLAMEFAVAMNGGIDETTTAPSTPWWPTAVAIAVDDDTPPQIAARTAASETVQADRDVFVLKPSADGLLALNGNAGASTSSDTAGTLYGPLGQIAMATDGGPNKHFGFANIPVKTANYYAVVVSGTVGQYTLDVAVDALGTDGTSSTDGGGGFTTATTITAVRTVATRKNRHRHLFTITSSGTLQLESRGNDDMYGTLYGPDGRPIRANDNGGQGRNFRIVARVTPGLYLLEVEVVSDADGNDVAGTYTLESNFLRGATIDEPGDGNGEEEEEEEDDRRDGATPPAADLDPEGRIEEPAHGSVRSGIGMIRGWVCNDGGDDVTVEIMDADTERVVSRLAAPNGSPRADVNDANRCDPERRAADYGFLAQFNYNILAAGDYTIRAFIGSGRAREQIGQGSARRFRPQENTFTVVRISDEEYLTDEELGLEPDDDPIECEVPNFPPDTRQTVILEWDTPSQNFQIVDVE